MAVVSGGTFVASALEHAGFLTQARFLEEFKEFFQYGGGLLYLIAGIGALASVAMFGSYRAARYLLIGPALFWFLVGPTTSTDGVLWRLGGGQFRGEGTAVGEAAAREHRQKVLKEVGLEADAQDVKVATGFWIWAWPMNEFVREFINVVLKDEDGHDKLAVSKTRGLEILFHQLPTKPEFLNRLEQGLMKDCSEMMNYAVGGSHVYIRESAVQAAGAPAGTQDTLKKYYADKVKKASKRRIPTQQSGFKEYIEINAETKESKAGKHMENGLAKQYITCADAWDLIAEELWYLASANVEKIIRTASAEDPANLSDTACRAMEIKLFGQTSDGNCEESLKAGIAISVLAGQMKRDDTFSRIFKRHWNDRDLINPKISTIITGPTKPDGYDLVRENGTAKSFMTLSEAGVPSMLVAYEKRDANDPTKVDRFYAPMVSIDSIDGVDHAMWVSMARFQTNVLRQQIFTWAMQLPYFQGVLLFLIAAVYPFYSMIVLLPGRAHNFINLPLAYLWVKSWDIGLASIVILDKVLYNLLPTANFAEGLRKGPWSGTDSFTLALSEAFKFDPTFGPHLYYANLAMVMLAIPPIFGAVIMKGRTGALAAWTSAVGAQAQEAGSRLGQAYGAVAADDRHRMGLQMQGYARRSVTLGSDAQGNGTLGGADAKLWGKAAGAGEAMKRVGDMAKHPVSTASAIAGADEKSRFDVQRAGLNYDAALRSAMDPMLGRWGMLPMLKSAYYAAMDPGGFEVEDRSVTPASELTDLFLAKFRVAASASEGVIGKVISTSTDKPTGVLDVMMYGSIMTLAPQMFEGGNERPKMQQLKELIGATAFSDVEVMSRVFHIDAEDMNGVAPIRGSLLGAKVDLFDSVFDSFVNEPQSTGFAPGGVNAVIDRHLTSTGGARWTAASAAGEQPGGMVGAIKTAEKTVETVSRAVTPSALAGEHENSLATRGEHSRFLNQSIQGLPEVVEIRSAWASEQPELDATGFEADKQFDDHLQKHFSRYGAVRDTIVRDLASYYGYEAVEDMGDIADRLRSDYAKAKERARVQPGAEYFEEIQFGEIPAQYLEIADSQPLLAGQLIEEWNRKRLRKTAEVFGNADSTDEYITTPADLFHPTE